MYSGNSSTPGTFTVPNLTGRTLQKYLGWNFSSSSTVVNCILTIVLNSVVIVLLVRDARTRTPFAIYLICLLFTNIFDAILAYPLFVVNSLYSTWYLSSAWCTARLYGVWVIPAVAVHSHVLIALNRIWALTWPHSYRNRHTNTFAALVCGGMCVYVHIIFHPGLIPDDLYYRVPLSKMSCFLSSDAQPEWYLATNFLVYVIPEILIIFSFPYLYYKHKKRRRPRTDAPPSRPTQDNGITGVANETAFPEKTEQGEDTSTFSPEAKARPFLILTLLTLVVILCWTPANTFYTVWAFMNLSEYKETSEVVTKLYGVQGILDPIIFAFALKDVRKYISKLRRTWGC